MLGLALGSWFGGRCIGPLVRITGVSPNKWYALAEFLIGLNAFVVPVLFIADEKILLRFGETNSFLYLLCSAFLITISILPFCFFMGTTFPFIMDYIRKTAERFSGSFSFLYLANVLGSMAGVVLTAAVLIEICGFNHTLLIAGILNFIIAGTAFFLRFSGAVSLNPAQASGDGSIGTGEKFTSLILFMSGFTALGMEVIWTRAFTPILGTQVYTFASLLAGYLLATWVGSYVYRRNLGAGKVSSLTRLILILSIFAFFPVVFNDPHISLPFYAWFRTVGFFLVVIALLAGSIFPFCAALGYLTPLLIDERSKGDPAEAGKSYALNILGCIIGPLFASYVLLPLCGVKYSLILLALPYFVFMLVRMINQTKAMKKNRVYIGLSAGLLVISLFFSSTYELPRLKRFIVKRDHTATVTAYENRSKKYLLVNGVNISTLEPVTKIMAHLPLCLHSGEPRSALVICFGMGTTYRSLLSWNINTAAIELVPSVYGVFGFFFHDAEALLKSPKSRVIIDDGRRFLQRTKEKFDVITIDPPPPVEAAGSSLLYSREFYDLVKRRLNPGGILQQWFPYVPGGQYEVSTLSAVTQSIRESFPYVKAYVSIIGAGVHYIASMSPIITLSPEAMTARMPERARNDLLEWNVNENPEEFVQKIVSREVPLSALLLKDLSEDRPVGITDDRPYNEYFLWRRLLLATGSVAGQ